MKNKMAGSVNMKRSYKAVVLFNSNAGEVERLPGGCCRPFPLISKPMWEE